MFKVRCEYRYVDTIGIVLVYFFNGMPFVYDDIDEMEQEDAYVKACANAEETLTTEHLTRNSEYLIMEELHPLLFPIELDVLSVLPP